MKVYEGYRDGLNIKVSVNKHPLNPRWDLHNYSPLGFEWGCGVQGAAQLALAILADYLNDDQKAMSLCHLFKWAVIAKLPNWNWRLSDIDLDRALASICNIIR